MKPLYIFDLDGTLALNDHRKHFIADPKNQRWDEFYRACVDDRPNKPILHLFYRLITPNYRNDPYHDLLIFSGRSDLVYEETLDWFDCFFPIPKCFIKPILKMRKHGDNTPDEILKRQWYEELSQDDKNRLVCVFDDRQKVVDMWRSIGVTCLQVAQGDF